MGWYLENRSTDFAHFCSDYRARWYLSEYAVSKVAGTPISRKWPKYGQNTFSWIINEREFFRTNGRVRFFPLSCWSFMPSFVKILRPVFRESCSQTNQPTNQRTLPGLTSTDVENCNVPCTCSTLVLVHQQQRTWTWSWTWNWILAQ